MFEIELLLSQLSIELQDLQNNINKELNLPNKKLSDVTELLDKEKNLEFMINRLEEFKQSQIDNIEKIQYDSLDD